MTKAPICLQDLRRSLYVKAKAEPTWRSGDYTCMSARWKRFMKPTRWQRRTMEHREIDGVTFEAIEERMEAKFASFRFLRFGTVWSRELLSSFWSRSSKLTFNQDRMDIDPNELHMKR